MIESIRVPQKYFLCLGVVKSNHIGIFVRTWPWLNSFVHCHLKRKGTSKLVLAFHEIISAWLGLDIGNRGKPSMATKDEKLQQVKSFLSSSSVNDFRVIDFELTSKIRSYEVLISKGLCKQFLAKKLSESFSPSKITEYGERKWITLRYDLDMKMN